MTKFDLYKCILMIRVLFLCFNVYIFWMGLKICIKPTYYKYNFAHFFGSMIFSYRINVFFSVQILMKNKNSKNDFGIKF
ncbi:hypothetical protein IW22_22110 [Chryseobacterium sp. JM1]|nr:hypothetical protein IW22_22110 [Chryseobacterium sp. JM1]